MPSVGLDYTRVSFVVTTFLTCETTGGVPRIDLESYFP